MRDADCVELLQWALPRLRLRWPGFRTVRGQVRKRIARRMAELGLETAGEYRARLESDAAEWPVLDSLCRVTIGRFFRDRVVWERLRDEVMPAAGWLARCGGAELRCWSAGCGSGEEPYGLSILFRTMVAPRLPGLRLRVVATDVDAAVLERAAQGCYAPASLRCLPAWAAGAFEARGGSLCVRAGFREDVELGQQDLRLGTPGGTFQLVLCRNLAFTYFQEALQREVLERIAGLVPPGGFLVVGAHEALGPAAPFARLPGGHAIYRRQASAPGAAGREGLVIVPPGGDAVARRKA